MKSKVDIQTVTVIGGTGSLGRALLRMISDSLPLTKITVVSRDEHKQADLKRLFPKVDFHIADIRDQASLIPHVSGRDAVFHVAAMKHVDIIERNPAESIKTNIIGTMNVAHACEAGGVKFCIYSSTDKAVDPINTYGYCKALGEKYLFERNRAGSKTKFSVYRWGNVLGSNGSAIPFFIKTLKEEGRAYVTHQDMTRFWIPIDWAVLYMLRTFADASTTEAMIPPNLKAAPILNVIDTLADMLGIDHVELKFIGLRPGEKIHEAMFSQHSANFLTSDRAPRFSDLELRGLLEPFIEREAVPA